VSRTKVLLLMSGVIAPLSNSLGMLFSRWRAGLASNSRWKRNPRSISGHRQVPN